MPSDRDKVYNLEKDWDDIVGREAKPGDNLLAKKPIYEATATETISSDDQNLLVSLNLLTTAGFNSPLGRMIAEEAEGVFPRTLGKLHLAIERARKNSNPVSSSIKEQLRGQAIMAYAWGFTSYRTKRMVVKDEHILPSVMEISSTDPASSMREYVCSAANVKFESTLGTLLQSIDAATRKGDDGLRLFYTGSLHMLYALARLAHSDGISCTDQ